MTNLNKETMKRPDINKYPIVVDGKHQYYNDDIKKYIDYLEAENKQLILSGVSKCADEVIKYIENDAEIAMPVNELMHEDGRHLTKKEYGHVLLKYLIVELRERFC